MEGVEITNEKTDKNFSYLIISVLCTNNNHFIHKFKFWPNSIANYYIFDC